MHKLHQWLKKGGKLFILVDTPYLKNLEDFIPDYETRKARGEKWPGQIADTGKYLKKSYSGFTQFAHLLDVDILQRTLIESNFLIEEISTINRLDYPEDRRLDGRECVGAVAVKS